MRFKKVVKLFNQGNVCVTGLIGTGKDMLFSNVVTRRRVPYVSNIDYTKGKVYKKKKFKGQIVPKGTELYQELDFHKLDCGGNTYKNFISGDLKYYEFPYIFGSDIYISDVGVYLPSQYCNELNRDYKYFPTFMALQRHVARSSTHFNVQNLNRAWDKLREMSDIYIRTDKCIVLFHKIVIQRITIYDKAQSCIDRVKPCRIRVPAMSKKEVKQNAKMYIDKFDNNYGMVKRRWLFYINKSKYDTHHFQSLLANGIKS